ncbi:1603_t:CDS:1, partial [Acaulospora colombiana]
PSRREVLKQAGIILPSDMQTPLFPYQSYLKEFSLNSFEKMVLLWYNKSQVLDLGLKLPDKDYRKNGMNRQELLSSNFEILMAELSQLIFNSACLKLIDFSGTAPLPRFQSFSRFNFIGENVTSLSMRTLHTLNLNPMYKEMTKNQLVELLRSMETSFNKIECLDIRHFYNHVPEFVSLLKAQGNLQRLSLRYSKIVNPIFRVLSTMAPTTLTWLGLDMIHLGLKPLMLLTTCQNLRTLVLVNCLCRPITEVFPSEDVPVNQFVNLRKLHIIEESKYPHNLRTDLKEIFQMTSRSLREFTMDVACNQQIRGLLLSMIEFSPMITFLAVHASQEDIMFQEFYEWLKMSKLESLILKLGGNNVGAFIKYLGVYFPDSLVHFDLESLITPIQLSNFLNKCNQVNFKRIGLNDMRGINDEHLHILMKYAEYFGSLEIVEYDRWAAKDVNMLGCVRKVIPSRFNDEKLKKAGRFIRVIRRDESDPFRNPMNF